MLIKKVKVFCCGMILLSSQSLAATGENIAVPRDRLQQGQEFLQQGDFAQAIERWGAVLKDTPLDTSQFIETSMQLATAYQAVGNYALATATIQQAGQVAEKQGTPAQQVLVNSYLADVWLATQQSETAKTLLEENLTVARRLKDPFLLAHVLNNLGNVLNVQQEYAKALTAYTEVTELAQQSGNTQLQIQSLVNQAEIQLKLDDPQASLATLERALTKVRELANSYEKGLHLLGIGQLAMRIQRRLPSAQSTAYQVLQEALQVGEKVKNQRLMAYAKGFLGELYEHQQRYPEALQLTRQALFLSQESPDISYLWEWALGRILLAQKDLAGASTAYQLARDHLYRVQTRLVTGQRNTSEAFQMRVRPVYFGLADVLLQQAALTSSPADKQTLLTRAREVLEQLKVAELQDYFQDECVSKGTSQATPLESLAPKTAVFYPILLSNRTELLLTLPDRIHQVVVPIGSDELGKVVLEFRQNLQTGTHNRFAKQAQQLYNWLIVPVRDKLVANHINTLVVIPDGPLRTIPMAALYNGETKKFLVEEFAMAMTPGLTLTAPRPLMRTEMSILLNGLSEGVQNFPPLPNVPQEISKIESLFSNHAILLDKAFLLNDVNQALQKTPYSIVHLASHGQFDRDPKKTFVLTYDDKLTMNRLEKLLSFTQLRKEPVELLTLSACQTAVGDERAALGLAGVAVKAGARSALASLWFVNDESTTELVTEFYHQLQNPALSKAQALQNAQKQLIESPQYRHPLYWAPFLLIGNWL
jgi:CHAT domain-containing protein